MLLRRSILRGRYAGFRTQNLIIYLFCFLIRCKIHINKKGMKVCFLTDKLWSNTGIIPGVLYSYIMLLNSPSYDCPSAVLRPDRIYG